MLAWARIILFLHSRKVTFSLSGDLSVRQVTDAILFPALSFLAIFSRRFTGKVVDDKKVFRKFVNIQEENNNPQK